jgi:membrane protease YdiL (CAAX protease family)
LAAEFAMLYLALAMALVMPPDWLWPVFAAVVVVAVVLLVATPGFRWSELAAGWRRLDLRLVAAVAAVTAAVSGLVVWWLLPGQAFLLPRRLPWLWLTIMAFYPLLSALPQELIFRVLFFRRYGGLFRDRGIAVVVSAAVFALAHLMFCNWVAVGLSFVGGLIFARVYAGRGGFALAVVLHAVCGMIVFSSGLGAFFYHGAVAR